MNSVIIDANLLLLLSVGRGSESDIMLHKRLWPRYDIDKLRLLHELLSKFKKWIITPHVLTETDYFVRQLSGSAKVRSLGAFCELIDTKLIEVHSHAKETVTEGEFSYLGLADVSQILANTGGRTLLTADGPLYAAASNRGLSVINFWHEWAARVDL